MHFVLWLAHVLGSPLGFDVVFFSFSQKKTYIKTHRACWWPRTALFFAVTTHMKKNVYPFFTAA